MEKVFEKVDENTIKVIETKTEIKDSEETTTITKKNKSYSDLLKRKEEVEAKINDRQDAYDAQKESEIKKLDDMFNNEVVPLREELKGINEDIKGAEDLGIKIKIEEEEIIN